MTKKFFEYFGIESPAAPLLVPEFSNPLFLKLLCSGLNNEGLRRLPKGFRGITKVFEFLIESTNRKLAKELGYDPDDRYVQATADRLAHAMAEKSQAWLEKPDAKRIIEQIRSEPVQYEKTLYRNLLHEGLLKEDLRLTIGDSQQRQLRVPVVSFAYERLANHLIVAYGFIRAWTLIIQPIPSCRSNHFGFYSRTNRTLSDMWGGCRLLAYNSRREREEK